MKKTLALLLVLALCLSGFAGCGKKKDTKSQELSGLFGTGEATEAPTEASAEAPTEVSTEAPATVPTQAPTEAPTEASTEAPTEPPDTSYILNIPAGTEVYSDPGYNGRFVMVVEPGGLYTIVEEQKDRSGDLWGKLRSGAGWINITQMHRWEAKGLPITAAYADDYVLDKANYDLVIVEDSPYSVDIIFRAYENLEDVTLFQNIYDYETGWEYFEEYLYLKKMTPDRHLVVRLVFGDVTTYFLSFTDASGLYHVYRLCQSGKDGSLVFEEV